MFYYFSDPTKSVNRQMTTNLSPKKVTEGIFALLKSQKDKFWESERLVNFPITEKDGITKKTHYFLVSMESANRCFYLRADELQKRKDILEILPVQSLPIPKFWFVFLLFLDTILLR